MQIKKNNTLVFLSGGLGNQLFQISAALFHAQGNRVEYNSTIGRPRLGSNSRAQIECFTLPNSISWDGKNRSTPWLSKVYGYALRSGFNPNRFESLRPFRWMIKCATEFVMFFATGNLMNIKIGQDVGFSRLSKDRRNSALIGYFQSYRWLEDPSTRKALSQIRAKDFQSREYFSNLANQLKPILIHIRLTDYALEDNFGLLSADYYKNAINELFTQLDQNQDAHFWVFSDDIPSAKNFLNFISQERLTWIEEVESCPAKTLEVMSMCSHFIISNSTFSWWAAAIRKNQDARVIYPSPWFKNASTPLDLTPKSWTSVNSSWRK